MKKIFLVPVLIALFFFEVVSEESCRCLEEDEIIDCSSSGLMDFKVPDACATYKKINLSVNYFRSISRELMNNFIFINISKNEIETLEVEYGISVKILDISSNKILKITLGDKYLYLNQLFAANNKLYSGSDSYLSGKCDKLIFLDISRNNLTRLDPITNCKHISYLDVSHNRIQEIPATFSQLNEIEHVDFSNNALKSLDHLPKSVVTLDISRNTLTGVEKTYFAGLRALQVLNLSRNLISVVDKDAFAQLESLQRLDLSSNEITVVPTLALSAGVQSVSLANNKITNIDVNVLLTLLNATDRVVDMRENPFAVKGLLRNRLVPLLDESGVTVKPDDNCTCVNVTHESAVLMFCLGRQEMEELVCWVDIARRTTSSSTTTSTTSSTTLSTETPTEDPETTSANASDSGPEERGAGAGSGTNATEATFLRLDGAKLSFLGFLLLTFLALLVANCVVGEPVVDDRWWEEKLRGDRVAS